MMSAGEVASLSKEMRKSCRNCFWKSGEFACHGYRVCDDYIEIKQEQAIVDDWLGQDSADSEIQQWHEEQTLNYRKEYYRYLSQYDEKYLEWTED